MDFPLLPTVCALFELKVDNLYFHLIQLSCWMFCIQFNDIEHIFAGTADSNTLINQKHRPSNSFLIFFVVLSYIFPPLSSSELTKVSSPCSKGRHLL